MKFGYIDTCLVDTVAALAFYTVVCLASALKFIECGASVERLAVQNVDASQVKGLCCLEGLGGDASLEPEGLWRRFG